MADGENDSTSWPAWMLRAPGIARILDREITPPPGTIAEVNGKLFPYRPAVPAVRAVIRRIAWYRRTEQTWVEIARHHGKLEPTSRAKALALLDPEMKTGPERLKPEMRGWQAFLCSKVRGCQADAAMRAAIFAEAIVTAARIAAMPADGHERVTVGIEQPLDALVDRQQTAWKLADAGLLDAGRAVMMDVRRQAELLQGRIEALAASDPFCMDEANRRRKMIWILNLLFEQMMGSGCDGTVATLTEAATGVATSCRRSPSSGFVLANRGVSCSD
ncbi:MAG: hypothetical protein M0002_13530 [Rhodospirillales bacterium]|nr:hypothetical protein [Rhodospirillales bacterium]